MHVPRANATLVTVFGQHSFADLLGVARVEIRMFILYLLSHTYHNYRLSFNSARHRCMFRNIRLLLEVSRGNIAKDHLNISFSKNTNQINASTTSPMLYI